MLWDIQVRSKSNLEILSVLKTIKCDDNRFLCRIGSSVARGKDNLLHKVQP